MLERGVGTAGDEGLMEGEDVGVQTVPPGQRTARRSPGVLPLAGLSGVPCSAVPPTFRLS